MTCYEYGLEIEMRNSDKGIPRYSIVKMCHGSHSTPAGRFRAARQRRLPSNLDLWTRHSGL